MVNETIIIAVSVTLILLFLAAIVACVWFYVCCCGQSTTDIYQRQHQSVTRTEPKTAYHPKYSTASYPYVKDMERRSDQLSYNEQQALALSPIRVQPTVRSGKLFKSEPDLSFEGMGRLLGDKKPHYKLSVPDMLDNELELDETMFEDTDNTQLLNNEEIKQEEEGSGYALEGSHENEVVANLQEMESPGDKTEENHAMEESTESLDVKPPVISITTTKADTVQFVPSPMQQKPAESENSEIEPKLEVIPPSRLSPVARRRSGRIENTTEVLEELSKMSPSLNVSELRDHFESPSNSTKSENSDTSLTKHSPTTKTMTTTTKLTVDKNVKSISPLVTAARKAHTSPLAVMSYKAEKRGSVNTLEPFTDSSDDEEVDSKDSNGFVRAPAIKEDTTLHDSSESDEEIESDYSEDDDECELIQPLKPSGGTQQLTSTGPGPKSPPRRKVTPASGNPFNPSGGSGGASGRYKPGSQRIDKQLTIMEEEEEEEEDT